MSQANWTSKVQTGRLAYDVDMMEPTTGDSRRKSDYAPAIEFLEHMWEFSRAY